MIILFGSTVFGNTVFARAVFGIGVLLIFAMDQVAMAQNHIEKIIPSVVSVLPASPDGSVNLTEPEGSGIVIADGSKILTSAHVLRGAVSLKVKTFDGEIIAAEIIWQDRPSDVALLEITKFLQPVEFNPNPQLGEPVCAIGNSFGLGLSVSCGVISAVQRTGTGFNPIEDFLQTDAAVNPGKTGGALIDASGRVVGLLSAIFTKNTDANIGVNFAVSTRLLQSLLRLKDNSANVDWRTNPLKLTSHPPNNEVGLSGAKLLVVEDGSTVQKTGFMADDIIIRAGNRRIKKPSDFKTEFAIYESNIMPITLVRNQQEMQLNWHFQKQQVKK